MRGFARAAVLGVVVGGLLGLGCIEGLLSILPDDDFGLNHDFESAYDVTAEEGVALDGALLTHPEDYFVVTVPDNAQIVVSCAAVGGPVTDLVLSLYSGPSEADWLADGTGDPLLIDYTGGGSGADTDYYIKVEYVGTGADAYILMWDTP